MLSQILSDQYRCPSSYLNFVLAGELSTDEGYFSFGPDITCYGRSSAGVRKSAAGPSLFDLSRHVSCHGTQVGLPFDPTEVINNLRLERYLKSDGGAEPGLLRQLYYYARPYTTRAMRRQVQKFHARNWKKRIFPRWPVDTTVEDLFKELLVLSMKAQGITEIPFIWFWPESASSALIMTHDVETIAGADFCSGLMDLNDAYGIKASFQIVPEQRYPVSQQFLESIRSRDFDVAVQDLNHDGRLFDDREEFLRRAAIINRYAKEYGAIGFRAAVLYRRPEWYEALNFSFDMSMPNVAPIDPQRGGCCTVMPYFIGNILELPVTTVQDYTLFHVLNQRSIDLWNVQMDLILEKNGLMGFIVHPDYIIEQDTREVYEGLLQHIQRRRQEEGIWCARPAEVDTWWRERQKMTLEKAGNTWRIKGKGAERAKLAFARLTDDRLVYELAGAPVSLVRASATR
jgi:hypothetical protein